MMNKHYNPLDEDENIEINEEVESQPLPVKGSPRARSRAASKPQDTQATGIIDFIDNTLASQGLTRDDIIHAAKQKAVSLVTGETKKSLFTAAGVGILASLVTYTVSESFRSVKDIAQNRDKQK
jgi:hypothetical protein